MFKSNVIYLIAFFFCLFSSKAVFPQNPQWIVYDTTNSDLLSNLVYCITIDESNNKWVNCLEYSGFGGYQSHGVTKFDGEHWTTFTTSNSDLPDNWVECIAADKFGHIWIGTQNEGLVKYDGLDFVVFNTNNSGLPANNVTCIAIDNSDNKWIGTSGGGLAKFDNNDWKVYSQKGNYINYVVIDYLDHKWISNESGLIEFDNTEWIEHYYSTGPFPASAVSCMALDNAGNKWIGSEVGGVACFDGENWNIYNTDNSKLPGNEISGIIFDEFENLWIGTNGGLAKLYKGDWTIYNTQNSKLPNNIISSITMDQLGNIWMASEGISVFNENGIVSVDENKNYHFTYPNSFQLHQNYPNPFNSKTIINYELTSTNQVELSIYNLLGQKVATLVTKKQPAGSYKVQWDATGFSSGVYFYKLQTDQQFAQIRKLVLIK